MPFALDVLPPRSPQSSQRILRIVNDYDGNLSSSSSSAESNETLRSSGVPVTAAARPRANLQRSVSTQASTSTALGAPEFLLPPSNTPSPAPSRSSSPLPIHYASPGASSSSYTSDADSEPTSPLFGHANTRRTSWWNDDTRSWWLMGSRPADARRRRRRRLRHDSVFGVRTLKRYIRHLIRHPFFPRQPTSIIFSLLIITAVAILITLLLMHILNPDKAPLPWRTYCSIPYTSTAPPALTPSRADDSLTVQVPVGVDPSSPDSPLVTTVFPPSHLDSLPPAGIFLGVFTTDSAVERRMLIRSTWASQARSRVGAGDGDGGKGTSRTIVRFVLGKPRNDWDRRIKLEAETYNDMIVLPISENMNSGKTHAFFTWASENSWVPSPSSPSLQFSYSNQSAPAPHVAMHDPDIAGSRLWVRPDYVVKADDDSFVMLAELEARLRIQLGDAIRANTIQRKLARDIQDKPFTYQWTHPHTHFTSLEDPHLLSQSLSQYSEPWSSRSAAYTSAYAAVSDGMHPVSASGIAPSDPLIYWGYLVKNRFMAGELYALSWSLVDWIAKEPTLRSMIRGKEDKQTAKWLQLHPRAEEVRWATDRCWIYDHPRAGTVYSHGFLFPSEATRVRRSILSLLRPLNNFLASSGSTDSPAKTGSAKVDSGMGSTGDTTTFVLPSPFLLTTPSYSYSSVSQFGTHHVFPLATLTPEQSIEALVEGSPMSSLFEGGPETAAQAWEQREGRRQRYEGRRVGGTVVVHFIKRNEWFLETALALLSGEDAQPGEESKGKGAETHKRAQTEHARSGHPGLSKRRIVH